VTAAARRTGPEPVRVGIVGFGLRASLARAVVESGLGEVSTVLDPSERGRSDARQALGGDLPLAESLDALLASGVEAIMVLSPDHTHHDVAVAALRAGVPVFCEKPLATTIADCDDVLRAAHESRTRLYVGHNMRHRTVGLVPPLRRPRRRLLLPRLARRPAALHGSAAAEGRPRPGRHPLARRWLHPTDVGDGSAGGLRGDRRTA
jgi:hypothetical protein